MGKDYSEYKDTYNRIVDYVNMGRSHEYKRARKEFGRLEMGLKTTKRVLSQGFFPAYFVNFSGSAAFNWDFWRIFKRFVWRTVYNEIVNGKEFIKLTGKNS